MYLNVKDEVWKDIQELVESPKYKESATQLLQRIYTEFSLMQNCLQKHGLLDELHPEWKYSGE